jgi:CSLREA domain-containing protein
VPAKTKSIRLAIIITQILLIGAVSFAVIKFSPAAHAAATITVTTQSDVTADDGECTLREAIIAANDDTASGVTAGECIAGSGADTIEFAITGTADFTNNGQDGYVIKPTSNLPDVNDRVTIDGYSQPGSEANQAIAPLPFDGTLLIEIDYSEANGRMLGFFSNSGGSVVRGLSLYGATAAAIYTHAPNIVVQGNYIGTDATGQVDKGNCVGLSSSNGGGSPDHSGQGALIGGLNPEDRNIISGNSRNDCGYATGGYPDSNWLIQGNYVGLAADGVTAIPNAPSGGPGGFSIDNCNGTIVGGAQPGAVNVISGNNGHGLAPDGIDDLVIQGNYIGTDYTGLVSMTNGGGGIVLGDSHNALIGGSAAGEGNVIGGEGIYTNTAEDVTIQGNYVGVGVDGVTNLPAAGHVGIVEFQDSTGIFGGTDIGEGNIVANGDGIGVNSNGTSKMAVVGNSIYDNLGLGMSYDANNDTLNDALDIDSGGNDHLNHPDNFEYVESGSDTNLTYTLDVPAGDYRIEFFSNTAADPSGYGEGETYLGFQNVTTTGTGSQDFAHTLTGVSIPNISATATFIDEDQPSGFGYTSAFSAIAAAEADMSLTKSLLNPQDVEVGAHLNYQLTATNNGPGDADLSAYGAVLGGPALIYDLVPADLINPSGYISDGPVPGTYVIDVGNPDLTCIYGPAPTASMLGFSTDSDLGVVVCWLTDSDTTLEPNSSISANLTFEVSSDSDLEFTNYALVSASSGDHDTAVIDAAVSSGDLISYFNSQEDSVNNFAAAAYPASIAPDPGTGGGSSGGGNSSGILAGTGQTTLLVAGIAALFLLSAGAILSRALGRVEKVQ